MGLSRIVSKINSDVKIANFSYPFVFIAAIQGVPLKTINVKVFGLKKTRMMGYRAEISLAF